MTVISVLEILMKGGPKNSPPDPTGSGLLSGNAGLGSLIQCRNKSDKGQ
jgi:hypothetical protein